MAAVAAVAEALPLVASRALAMAESLAAGVDAELVRTRGRLG